MELPCRISFEWASDRIVSQVQEERSVVRYGLIDGLVCLQCQSFREEHVFAVVGVKPRHISNPITLPPHSAEVLGAEKATWSARSMTSDVLVETNVGGVAPGRANCAKVSLAGIDRTIANFAKARRHALACTVRSIPATGLSPFTFHFGNSSRACFRSLLAFFFSVQFVTRCRAAFRPVMRLTRVGEQTLHAYVKVDLHSQNVAIRPIELMLVVVPEPVMLGAGRNLPRWNRFRSRRVARQGTRPVVPAMANTQANWRRLRGWESNTVNLCECDVDRKRFIKSHRPTRPSYDVDLDSPFANVRC